jgi:hypothetical protein
MNDTPLDFTDYQTEYGQGEKGLRRPLSLLQANGLLEKNSTGYDAYTLQQPDCHLMKATAQNLS